ncbi:hypothetical protein EGJ27_04500 [Pseudomonas sp. v388]|uniref:hypothetical protein n=1 Tax=Pseudomonas sp. v388 TaxID=2479849 RepID=UPI000F7778FD|nr:hypothetical protein [Pseudomonas sp. v388]RRV09041.1 hypothetical protein EGJ27_04500 [Pseudomonas sp. v388]
MKNIPTKTTGLPHGTLDEGLPGKAFATGLRAFEIEALNARRGFQVAMAVNVFGVGTVLENNLLRR